MAKLPLAVAVTTARFSSSHLRPSQGAHGRRRSFIASKTRAAAMTAPSPAVGLLLTRVALCSEPRLSAAQLEERSFGCSRPRRDRVSGRRQYRTTLPADRTVTTLTEA